MEIPRKTCNFNDATHASLNMPATALRMCMKGWGRYVALLRVAAYLACAVGAMLLATARVARGAMGEATLSLGRQLEAIRDLLGSTKTAIVNGQRVFVSTAVVPLDVKGVLDRFERECAGHPNALAGAIKREFAADRLVLTPFNPTVSNTASAPSAPIGQNLRAQLGILREGDDNDGIVGCLVQHRDDNRSLLELASELGRTMDVGILGDFFYTYAVKLKNGQSHVITTWTHGSFRPGDMFPSKGDAPGTDSAIAARPKASRRIFSGVSADAPYAIRIYETSEDIVTMFRGLDRDMESRRWVRIEEVDAVSGTRAYSHESGIQTIASATTRGERTMVSLVEMGAPSSHG